MKLQEADPRSFSDPETTFYLRKFSLTNAHCAAGEHFKNQPTGEVVCAACWESADNVDEIEHKPECPQRHVHSRYWRETHDS